MSADTPGAAAAVRPARRQVQKSKGPAKFDPKKQPPSGTYNIWYDKHDGRSAPREKSNTRCSIESDAGWTKGVADPQAWICFKFAQGRCALGQDCGNLHCLPKGKFAAELPTARDCFGRERFATERDDRGGVGSFEKVLPLSSQTSWCSGFPDKDCPFGRTLKRSEPSTSEACHHTLTWRKLSARSSVSGATWRESM